MDERDHEVRYIPAVIFDDDRIVDPAIEQAFVLGEVYHKAAKKHLQLELKLLMVGMIFIFMGVAIAGWGIINNLQTKVQVAGILLIFLAVLILTYGFYIDKPMKLISLSKIYTVNHIFPFEDSVLVIDGTNVISGQPLQYRDIPINEITGRSKILPDLPITYYKEQQLLAVMKEKLRLFGDNRQFLFQTAVIKNNDPYAKAILECLEVSKSGRPNYGILEEMNYQKAEEHYKKIISLSVLKDSISVINNDINATKEKVNPFLWNLEECLSNIDNFFGKVNVLLSNNFFSGININADPLADEQYGYGIMKKKYHVAVRSTPIELLIPLNPVQQVIDNLDELVKEPISTIKRTYIKKIEDAEQFYKGKIEQTTKYFVDFEHEMILRKNGLDLDIQKLNLDAEVANSQARQDERTANRFRKQANEYNIQVKNNIPKVNIDAYKTTNFKDPNVPDNSLQLNMFKIQTSFYNSAKNKVISLQSKAEQCDQDAKINYEYANGYRRQIGKIRSQINDINSDIIRKRCIRDSNIEKMKQEEKQKITLLQNIQKKEIGKCREKIDSIIETRNSLIDMIESASDFISNEQEHHESPFNIRLGITKKLLNQNISELEECLRERLEVLENIDSMKIKSSNSSISAKPTSIMIPYWVARLKGKKETEYFILPLQKSKKPEKQLKRLETMNILTTLFESLESSKHYLKNNNVNEKSASYSVYPGNLAPDIIQAIDKLYLSGYFSKKIYKRIKKEYIIEGSG